MRTRYRITAPPAPLRLARRDNLALVPGSLLPLIKQCQEVANQLPRNAVLIVLPADNAIQRETLLKVAKLLAKEGHQVRVVPEAELARTRTYEQSTLDL